MLIDLNTTEEEYWPGLSDEKYEIEVKTFDENTNHQIISYQTNEVFSNALLFKVGHFEPVACHVSVPCYPVPNKFKSDKGIVAQILN